MKKYTQYLTLILILLSISLTQSHPAQAETPIVRAVFFFSPTCPHCHDVIENVIPPLSDQYGSQLQILGIDVSVSQGAARYQTFITEWEIPDNRLGVPALIVGERHLLGASEIPLDFPGIIENGLAQGGIEWPEITGIQEIVAQTAGFSSVDIKDKSVSQKFLQDPVGNSIAVIVLIGMIASVISALRNIQTAPDRQEIPWLIPALSVIGIIIAGYLSFVEVSGSEAVCGPVGDCNAVQQSSYARLFGVLPIGILGLVGYLGILIAWALSKYGSSKIQSNAILAMWGMAFFGVLFSIYLTFLEPFVIGATCAWCVSSAIVITLQFLGSTQIIRNTFALDRLPAIAVADDSPDLETVVETAENKEDA